MIQQGEISTRELSSRRITPRQIFAAALACAVLGICFFSGLAALGLMGPDEPRYAWIARHMAESGNWITPILYGAPWFEKPILYYWAAATAFKLIASPEWAARIPSAFAALIAALAMGWLALRRYGVETAWAVLLIFSTTVAAVAFARAASPDMLFTASLALALVCAFGIAEKRNAFGPVARSDDDNASAGKNDRRALIFLGVWMGFATLAKGPAAIVLAGGSVLLWAIVCGKLRTALRMLHPLTILFFCIVALPWYVLCALRNPDFFQNFIILHNFQRYLTPVFQHRQPFWFFLPILLLGLLPWTALLIGVIADGWRIFRARTWRVSPGIFLACWVIFSLIFFSASQSKLPEYILPVFPPLALLLARSFVNASKTAPRRAQWLGVATGITWVIFAIAGSLGFRRLPAYYFTHGLYRLILAGILVGLLMGAALEFTSLAKKFRLVIALSAGVMAALVVVASVKVLPALDPTLSARALSRRITHSPDLNGGLYTVGELNRVCQYGVLFYLQRNSLPAFNPHNPGEKYVLLSREGDMALNMMGFVQRSTIAAFPPHCWVEEIRSRGSVREETIGLAGHAAGELAERK